MSLEMAQYEATLCGLQTQVSDLETIVREKDEKINDLELKVSELNEDRRTIEEVSSLCRRFGLFCHHQDARK